MHVDVRSSHRDFIELPRGDIGDHGKDHRRSFIPGRNRKVEYNGQSGMSAGREGSSRRHRRYGYPITRHPCSFQSRSPKTAPYALNDYLWGKCEISQTAYDVTSAVDPSSKGRLFLIPSSIRTGDIARVIHYGYDVNLLKEGCQHLIRELPLDYLFIDTHPGLNEETLLSIAIADILLIILRPDYQDYQGTAVTVEVSRHLDVPRMYLIVNKAPACFTREALVAKVTTTYGCEVVGVLPHAEEMMTLASSGIFAVRYPDHRISRELRAVADRIEE